MLTKSHLIWRFSETLRGISRNTRTHSAADKSCSLFSISSFWVTGTRVQKQSVRCLLLILLKISAPKHHFLHLSRLTACFLLLCL